MIFFFFSPSRGKAVRFLQQVHNQSHNLSRQPREFNAYFAIVQICRKRIAMLRIQVPIQADPTKGKKGP